jgi:hypothetical protein
MAGIIEQNCKVDFLNESVIQIYSHFDQSCAFTLDKSGSVSIGACHADTTEPPRC